MCWELRAKLADLIETKTVEHEGKVLKVKVDEPPERRAKNAVVWRAVDALKKFVSEDKLIKEPATYCIHDSETCSVVGSADGMHFSWNERQMASAFLDINLAELRKACLRKAS